MPNTLGRVGTVLSSIAKPTQFTVVSPELPPESASVSVAGSNQPTLTGDTGLDITLGRPKAGAVRPPPQTSPRPRSSEDSLKVAPLASRDLVISPAFKLIVIGVFAIMILTGAGAILLALYGNPTAPGIQSVSSMLANAFTACLGAILGLIGGKAVP